MTSRQTAPDAVRDRAELGQCLRLRTLVRLRWLAVVGQTAAVSAFIFVLGFPLPLGLCLAVIALSAWLNIFLTMRWRKSVRLQPPHAGLLLAYDILQLAVLLYLTGGLENPFAFLFLVPVTVSATSLSLHMDAVARRHGLCLRHLPCLLPSAAALVCRASRWSARSSISPACGRRSSAAWCSRRSMPAASPKRRARCRRRLSATEMVLAREQRLSALDGLAAAAAHELGTPLATIALVAKELKRELPANGPHTEDIDLLISQAGALPRNPVAACQSRGARPTKSISAPR